MNGIGGGGLMTVYMAAGGGGSIDYGMQAPGAATTDEFPLEGGTEGMDTGSSRYSRNYAWPKVKDDMLSSGYKSIAIPGTVAAEVPRFVGASGASPKSAEVCMPR